MFTWVGRDRGGHSSLIFLFHFDPLLVEWIYMYETGFYIIWILANNKMTISFVFLSWIYMGIIIHSRPGTFLLNERIWHIFFSHFSNILCELVLATRYYYYYYWKPNPASTYRWYNYRVLCVYDFLFVVSFVFFFFFYSI